MLEIIFTNIKRLNYDWLLNRSSGEYFLAFSIVFVVSVIYAVDEIVEISPEQYIELEQLASKDCDIKEDIEVELEKYKFISTVELKRISEKCNNQIRYKLANKSQIKKIKSLKTVYGIK